MKLRDGFQGPPARIFGCPGCIYGTEDHTKECQRLGKDSEPEFEERAKEALSKLSRLSWEDQERIEKLTPKDSGK